MKRCLLVGLAIVITAWPGTTEKLPVGRGALAALERKFDKGITAYDINDPFHLLGNTRGVYLEDYGVVFTSELNLVAAATVTPFRPSFSKEQIEQLRQKKLGRLAELKQMMREMLVDSAVNLKGVPVEKQIALGVSLFRFGWEDHRELPAQILMEARRQELLDFESGKLDSAGLEAAIRIREF